VILYTWRRSCVIASQSIAAVAAHTYEETWDLNSIALSFKIPFAFTIYKSSCKSASTLNARFFLYERKESLWSSSSKHLIPIRSLGKMFGKVLKNLLRSINLKDLSQSVSLSYNRLSNDHFWLVAISRWISTRQHVPDHAWHVDIGGQVPRNYQPEKREENEAGGNDGGECWGHGGKKQETNGGRGWWTRKGHWHVVESSRFIGRVRSPHG